MPAISADERNGRNGLARAGTDALRRPPGGPCKICQDRVADILRQWQTVRSTRLALDRQVAGPPVDVVETHVLNITGTQAEPGEQENDGLVPDFYRTICRTGR
jgi:hypothetical protein